MAVDGVDDPWRRGGRPPSWGRAGRRRRVPCVSGVDVAKVRSDGSAGAQAPAVRRAANKGARVQGAPRSRYKTGAGLHHGGSGSIRPRVDGGAGVLLPVAVVVRAAAGVVRRCGSAPGQARARPRTGHVSMETPRAFDDLPSMACSAAWKGGSARTALLWHCTGSYTGSTSCGGRAIRVARPMPCEA